MHAATFCSFLVFFTIVPEPVHLILNLDAFGAFLSSYVEVKITELIPNEALVKRVPAEFLMLVEVSNLSLDTVFTQVDIHSQIYPLKFSLRKGEDTPGTFTVGNHIGLIKLCDVRQDPTFYLYNENKEAVNVTFIGRVGELNDPIPGGCNEEFEPAIAPYISSNWLNKHAFQIAYAPAGLSSLQAISYSPAGLSAIQAKNGSLPVNETEDPWPSCDNTIKEVAYRIYTYYLHQEDYSENGMTEAIKVMSDPQKIHQFGYPVASSDAYPYNRASFVAYPDSPIVINVAVYKVNSSDPPFLYTPTVIYPCNRTSYDSECPEPVPLYDTVICSLMIVVGVFIALCSRRYFEATLVIHGYCCGSFVAYLIVFAANSPANHSSELYTEALFLGLIGAGVWWVLWNVKPSPMIVVLKFSVTFGCLLAASIYFIHPYLFPTSVESILHSNLNFWLIFVIIVLIVPIIGIIFLETTALVMSCSFGSFLAMYGLGVFLRSSFPYIIINVINRLLLPGYDHINLRPPFFIIEINLFITWMWLTATGVLYQLFFTQFYEPFPQPYFSRRNPNDILYHTPTFTPRSSPLVQPDSESRYDHVLFQPPHHHLCDNPHSYSDPDIITCPLMEDEGPPFRGAVSYPPPQYRREPPVTCSESTPLLSRSTNGAEPDTSYRAL